MVWSIIQRILLQIGENAMRADQQLPVAAPRGGKRVALIVGHSQKSKGYVSPFIGSEWDFNRKQMLALAKMLNAKGYDARVFYRITGDGYSSEIREVYGKADQWGADVTLEAHFNAHDSAVATGTEMLHSSSASSKRLAGLIQKAALSAYGLRDRGIKRPGKRGGLSLIAGKAPAVLMEPGFGSNPKDAASLKKNGAKFNKFAAQALDAYFEGA